MPFTHCALNKQGDKKNLDRDKRMTSTQIKKKYKIKIEQTQIFNLRAERYNHVTRRRKIALLPIKM